MKNRTTFALIALFSFSLAALWWAESRNLPTDRDRRAGLSLVFPDLRRTRPGEVESISVERPSVGSITVDREPGGLWRIKAPVDAPADPALVETLVRNLLDLRKSPDAGTIEGASSEFGLAPPAATVVLLGKDRAAPIARLRVGRALGNRLYVAPGADDSAGIEVVDARLLGLLGKPAVEWRDHSLFRMPTFRVAGMIIDRPGENGRVELARHDRGWRMLEPVMAPADADKVEGLLAELGALHAAGDSAGFVADGVTDLASFGLDAPELTLTMTPFSDAGAPQTVKIGKAVPDAPDQRYAIREGTTNVVLVNAKSLFDSYQGPTWLRSQRVTEIVPELANRLVIDAKGATVELVRGPTGWRRVRPSESGADAIQVQTLLTALAFLETSEFLSESVVPLPELDPPATRVRLWQDVTGKPAPTLKAPDETTAESPALDLALGRHDPIRKTVFARIAGDPTVLALPDTILKALPSGPEAFRDLKVLSFSPADVDRLTVERPGQSVTIQAPGSGTASTAWRLVEPVVAPADQEAVTTLLVTISSLRAESWESDKVSGSDAFGLETPALRLRWSTRAEGPTGGRALRIGKRKPGSTTYFANVEGEGAVFTVSEADAAALDAELRDSAVMRFEPDRVSRLVFRWPNRALAMIKGAGPEGLQVWRAEPGYDHRGFDASRLDEFLKGLSEFRTPRFLQYHGPIGPDYGLAPPRLAVELMVEGEPGPRTLLVGNAISPTRSIGSVNGAEEGPTFVLPTGPAWDRLIRSPSRPGELPDDVFAPAAPR